MTTDLRRRRRSRSWSGVQAIGRPVSGILAAVTLLAVLVGVPWALLRFTSWPITGLPTWQEITDVPARAGEDAAISAAATVGMWAAWALFAVCVAAEVAAEVRGTHARRLPAMGPLQSVARTLVASVAMSIGSFGSVTSAGAGGGVVQATSTSAVVEPAVDDESARPSSDPQHGMAAPDEQLVVDWRTVVVEHGDSAWDLAERYYGDGTRWTVLWNDNKHLSQTDGRSWARETDPVEPGWVLRLRPGPPSPAMLDSAVTASEEPTSHRTYPASGTARDDRDHLPGAPTPITVERGDNLWCIAENHLEEILGRPGSEEEIASYWVRVIESNRDRLVDPADPGLIYAGQELLLPPVEGEPLSPAEDPEPSPASGPPSRPPPEASPSSTSPSATEPANRPMDTANSNGQRPPATVLPGPASAPPRSATSEPDGRSSAVPVVARLGLGVALAVGVTRAIQIRRRRRNHHHPSTSPRPSSNPVLHGELIIGADETAHSRLRRGLYHLAVDLAASRTSTRPRIVQHDEDHLDVLLGTPVPNTSEGWHVQADGAIWSCDPGTFGTPVHADLPATTPLLVTLGQPEDGGQLYIDLEAEGLISVTGDPDVALDVARAFVTELAHSPLAEAAQIVVVGNLGHPAIARLDYVTVVDDWQTASDNLEAWVSQSHEALTHNGWPNTFLARAREPQHDALIPLVIVTDQMPGDPDALHLLLRGADPTPAAAVVVVGDVLDGSTVIECTPDRLTLPQLNLVCTPQTLDGEGLAAIIDLLDDAEDPAAEQLRLIDEVDYDDWEAYDAFTSAASDTDSAFDDGGYQDPPYDVLVKVLGDITIDGATKRLTPKQTAVVAYLALHRTATADRMADALWIEHTPSRRRRLANTISACRSAIGSQHLPVANDGTYRAGPRLLTDLDLIKARLTAASTQPTALAIETLRSAFDLVSGPVFTYPDNERASYAWVAVENWISIWEVKITAIARQLADHYLSTDATTDAIDIARRALRIVPTDTNLTELLMRAHAANGDRVAVRRVYHDHIDALAQLDLDDPADSTAALYAELRGSNSSA